MNINPLDSTVREKMKRAAYHIEDFKPAVGIGPKSKFPLATFSVHRKDDGTHEYSTNAPEPSPQARIIYGEAIHQLRSALDHLMAQLVFDRTKDLADVEQTQFPIFEDGTKFVAHKLYGFLRNRLGAGSDEFAAILTAQPYNRNPISPLADPLYVLTKLDNINKHRTILILNQTIQLKGYIDTPQGRKPFVTPEQVVKPGTQVLDLGGSVPHPPPPMQMDDLSSYVSFAETDGLCDGVRVFPMFRAMESAVACVVNDFSRFFST